MAYSGPASGLYLSPNPFNSAPDGSLSDATNVRFTNPGVLQPRPGFSKLEDSDFGNVNSRADSLGVYKRLDGSVSYMLAFDKTTVAENRGAHFANLLGTFVPPSDNRMRFEEAAKSMFWNTTQGQITYDGNVDPYESGCPPGLSILLLTFLEANGWMLGDSAVAYRYTVCRKDPYGRLIEGAPSGRIIVRNSIVAPIGGAVRSGNVVTVTTALPHHLQTSDIVELPASTDANFPTGGPFTVTVVTDVRFTYAETAANATNTVALTYTATRAPFVEVFFQNAPSAVSVTTDNFLRLYRSEMTATAGETPSDDLFLVFQTGFLTSAQISMGQLTITDITPEGFITGDQATSLYTDPNYGDGITAARNQPPVAVDMVYWANRMWWANTYERDFLEVDLIGTGPPSGLQAGDTITIANTVYTATSSTNPSAGQFTVATAGDPGPNIQVTALSLVNSINTNAQTDVFAYYVSDETGTPGKILLRARTFGVSFNVFSSRGHAWAPVLSASSATYITSSGNNAHPARLVYSPLGIPDAAPSVNYTEVNADNDPILRIFPLHYRLLVFKTDGIYYITNIEPFTILKLSDYKLIAPDSVHQLEDTVYALTDCGVIAITDGGIDRVSVPIDTALTPFTAPSVIDTYSKTAFGLGYRSERQSLLWTLSKTLGVYSADNTQAWVWSTLSQGYTRYDFGVRCGVVNPNLNQLVVAPTDSNTIWIENKTLTNADYTDLSFEVKAGSTGALASPVVAVASTAGITVGDALGFDPGSGMQYWTIVAIGTGTVTLLGVPAWSVTSGVSVYTVATGFSTSVVFNKLTQGSPGVMKMWQVVDYLWRTNTFYNWNASFSTNTAPSTENVLQVNDAWGLFSWGVLPWGNPCQQLTRVEPFPTEHGNAAQVSVGFNTRQAFANFEFLGMEVIATADTVASR